MNLPIETVFEIISYDDRFVVRNYKLMNRISKNDFRYKIIRKVPLKYYSYWHEGY